MASRTLGFARENGWFLLLAHLPGTLYRRVRNAAIGRRLGTAGLRLGRSPRLLGLAHCSIGRDFSAGHDLWLEAVTQYAGRDLNPSLTLGENCNLSDNVHIACANRITIGSGFLCGSHVIVTDHAHGSYTDSETTDAEAASDPAVRPALRPLSVTGSVEIGDNVWLGDGVVVLAGARIGHGAVIGANSVVSGVVAPETVAAGAPARPLRRWDAKTGTWPRVRPQAE